MFGVDRRQFVKGVCGVGGTAALAACLSNEQRADEPNATDKSNETEDGTRTDDARTDESESEPQPVEDDGDDRSSPAFPDTGTVVFVYDDGPMEDYTQAFPAHQAFDAPATTGIVTEWVGLKEFMDNDWMAVDHLETLVDAGWEIASHTTAHTSLASFELVESAEPTATRIYPSSPQHGFHHDKELEITDGDNSVIRTVVGSGEDDVGQYIDLNTAFAAEETVERYPDDRMHEYLRDSKRELEDLGFEVTSLLAPYDQFDDRARRITREYYDAVASAKTDTRVNDPDDYDPYRTQRKYFIEFTTADSVKRDLDTVADEGDLGVVGAHTFKDEVTEDGIYQTLEWVEERDVEVLTLLDAVERAAQ